MEKCPYCGSDPEYPQQHDHGITFMCGTFLLHDSMRGDIGELCIGNVVNQLAQRTRERDEARKYDVRKLCMVEAMAFNANISAYSHHWEDRAENAESKLERIRVAWKVLQGPNTLIDPDNHLVGSQRMHDQAFSVINDELFGKDGW